MSGKTFFYPDILMFQPNDYRNIPQRPITLKEHPGYRVSMLMIMDNNFYTQTIITTTTYIIRCKGDKNILTSCIEAEH